MPFPTFCVSSNRFNMHRPSSKQTLISCRPQHLFHIGDDVLYDYDS